MLSSPSHPASCRPAPLPPCRRHHRCCRASSSSSSSSWLVGLECVCYWLHIVCWWCCFLACENLCERFDEYLPCAFLLLLMIFFFLVFEGEICSRTPVPLFRPGSVHGGLAGWRSISTGARLPGRLMFCLCKQMSWITLSSQRTWGKELGKCTHQWTTNDQKNKQVLSTLSVFFRLKNKDRQSKGWNSFDSVWLPPSRLSSSLLLSSFLLLSVFLL